MILSKLQTKDTTWNTVSRSRMRRNWSDHEGKIEKVNLRVIRVLGKDVMAERQQGLMDKETYFNKWNGKKNHT